MQTGPDVNFNRKVHCNAVHYYYYFAVECKTVKRQRAKNLSQTPEWLIVRVIGQDESIVQHSGVES
jgi:hypothetical protein